MNDIPLPPRTAQAMRVRVQILDVLTRADHAMTVDEIGQAIGGAVTASTIRTRLNELKQAGLARAARRHAPGRGRPEQTWSRVR